MDKQQKRVVNGKLLCADSKTRAEWVKFEPVNRTDL